MASLLRAAAAAAVPARPDWTPEEAGRYAAARDVALLRALLTTGGCWRRRGVCSGSCCRQKWATMVLMASHRHALVGELDHRRARRRLRRGRSSRATPPVMRWDGLLIVHRLLLRLC